MFLKPFVSIVIPCRNEAVSIGRCLDSILAGDYPAERMEVLVADGRSEDGTRGLVELYAARDRRVRWIDNPEMITPVALNRGIRAARGDVIVRLDAHSTISKDYVRLAVEYLALSGASNVGGAMHTLAQDSGSFSEPIRIVLTHRFGVGNSRFRTGAEKPVWVDTVFGGCWPREVFTRIGLFNERLERSQDLEFNLRLRRAGGKILLAPDIESCYYARTTLKSFWRHNWINGVWAVLPFAYAQGMPVRWRHLVPLAFVISLAVSPKLVGIAYLCASLVVSIHTAWKQRSLRLALLLPAAFASLHLAYGAGSLWGLGRAIVAACRGARTGCPYPTLAAKEIEAADDLVGR
jgi:glycosyltransferase involved in cell wall biosynthesis